MRVSPLEWVRGIVGNVQREHRYISLDRLSDHLLLDIGLRRDQLDALRLRPAGDPREKIRLARRAIVLPTLQGCG